MQLRVVGPAAIGTAVTVMAAIQLLGLPSIVSDGFFFSVRVAAAVVAVLAVRRWPADRRRMPTLIAAGLAASALGDATYGLIDMAGSTPEASWADVPYLAGYALLFAALWRPPVSAGGGERVESLLDVITVATVAVTVLWHPLLHDLAVDPSRPGLERTVLVSYPVADALVLALTLRLLASTRWRSLPGWAVVGGVWCWAFGSMHFVLVEQGTWPAHVAWMVGSLLMAMATWAGPSRALLARQGSSGPRRPASLLVQSARVCIAIVPLAVPPALDLLLFEDGQHHVAPFVGMLVLLVVALVRTTLLLHSEATARAEVARSRRYFQKLTDHSSDAVVLLDRNGAVIDAAPPTADPTTTQDRTHDRTPTEIRSWARHIDTEHEERLIPLFHDLLDHPGHTLHDEVPITLPHTGQVWLSLRFTNLLHDPDVAGIVVSLSDVTARKQAELDLEHARDAALEGSRAKSAFLATMSHEIRTPLNGVIGLTSLLLTTDLDHRQHTYAHGVHTAGTALLGIINNILDFSKIEAGHLELEHIDFDLPTLLTEVHQLLAPAAHDKGLTLHTTHHPDLPTRLHGDPHRLRQVLLNLTANAIKFTHTGTVELTTRPDPNTGPHTGRTRVRFEVHDTGIGIDPDQHDHLFEAFSQADSSTTRRYGGTGLGLAISRQLVTAMDGTIGADPRPTGGTTFWTTIPLAPAHTTPTDTPTPTTPEPPPETPAEPPPETTPETGHGATPHAGSRGHVLVVEDNEVNQLVALGILEHLGYTAEIAEHGHAALTRLTTTTTTTTYDAVLMDCQMPLMDGYQTTTHIRAHPHLRHLPVIAMTAAATDDDRNRCLAAGMNDYIPKPVTPHDLATTLDRWVRRRVAPSRP